MKMLATYLEKAASFEKMASETPGLKQICWHKQRLIGKQPPNVRHVSISQILRQNQSDV